MYLEHYGLAEPPFRITPHTEFFYQGANRGATLEALQYAILHGEGLVKVTGEVGAGKTMLCRVLMERLPEGVDTVYLANPSMSKEEILLTIADELKIDLKVARSTVLIRALQEALIERYAAGRQVVVLIDEAHAMPAESLEEVRLLSNLEHGHHKLMQIVLFGQTELNDKLAPVDMRQLRERITHSFELAPLRQADVGEYLMFRLRAAGYKGPDIFDRNAISLIARESEGLTRRINILADKALIASFAAGRHQVGAHEAKAAIRDSGFRPRRFGWAKWAAASLVLVAAGLITGIVGTRLATNQTPTKVKQPAAPAKLQKPAATPPSAPTPAAVTTSAAATPAAQTVDSSPMGLLNERLEKSRNLLNQQAPTVQTVQLLVAPRQNQAELARFLANAVQQLPAESLYVYPGVSRRGDSFFALSYGLYPDAQQAAAALANLPANLQRNRPVLRTMAGIREEMWKLQ